MTGTMVLESSTTTTSDMTVSRARIRSDLKVEMVAGCRGEVEDEVEEEDVEDVGPVVTHITFPFSYRGLNFNFDNIPTGVLWVGQSTTLGVSVCPCPQIDGYVVGQSNPLVGHRWFCPYLQTIGLLWVSQQP